MINDEEIQMNSQNFKKHNSNYIFSFDDTDDRLIARIETENSGVFSIHALIGGVMTQFGTYKELRDAFTVVKYYLDQRSFVIKNVGVTLNGSDDLIGQFNLNEYDKWEVFAWEEDKGLIDLGISQDFVGAFDKLVNIDPLSYERIDREIDSLLAQLVSAYNRRAKLSTKGSK